MNLVNHLSYHIDDPIKKCVVGLNLLGISTAMSCCGFTYKGETVPKKHLKKSYIYVDLKKTESIGRSYLFHIAEESLWNLSFPCQRFCDLHGGNWSKESSGHPWNDESCPHFHEIFNLHITRLEKAINSFSHRFSEKTVIEDGNRIYKEEFCNKYWQYEPTESWEVTPEIFNSL